MSDTTDNDEPPRVRLPKNHPQSAMRVRGTIMPLVQQPDAPPLYEGCTMIDAALRMQMPRVCGVAAHMLAHNDLSESLVLRWINEFMLSSPDGLKYQLEGRRC